METLETLIDTCVRLGTVETLRDLGLHPGEISQREALRSYGTYFRQAVADGRIKPVRLGNGARPKKYYSVKEILLLKAKDAAKAQLAKL
jgi:hypothetical protein